MTKKTVPGITSPTFRKGRMSEQVATLVADLVIKGMSRAYPEGPPDRLTPEMLQTCIEASPLMRYVPESPFREFLPFTEEDEREGTLELFGTTDPREIEHRILGFEPPRTAQQLAEA